MKYLVIAALVIGGVFFFMNKGDTKNMLTYDELQQELASDAKVVLLDVRTKEEYVEGHIPGAVLLPYDQVPAKAATLLPAKNANIIVYCRSGRRSEIAANALKKMEYTKVRDFGGISNWKGTLEK